MELNPEHKVTKSTYDLYHKLLAIVIHKYKLGTVEIGIKDMIELEASYPGEMPTIIVKEDKDVLRIWLTTEKEGRKLMKEEQNARSTKSETRN